MASRHYVHYNGYGDFCMNAFAERLKELRSDSGLKQEELAKIIGLGRGRISLYETGKQEADYDPLIRIARHFDVSADYLLGLVDTRRPWAPPPPHIPVGDLDAEQVRKVRDYVRLIRADRDR